MKLNKDQLTKIVGIAMFSALFGYVYVVYFWLPTAKKIEENSKKVADIQSDIDKAKMQKAKCKNLEATLADLGAQKEAAQKKLPTGKKLPDLLRTLTDLSKKYKVNIKSIAPGAATREEYFMKAAYSISVTGDYHSLGRFLTALGLEERILTMENLTISGTPGAETSISANFTLIAYQYSG
ncbi:MAG: type 4a pilus biogenesis protein PilO [Elusimicrobia bacterium]|nr:type 4a pilus biogenesis protein PilO [Elusimicrobiota bacterium]